MTDQDSHEEVPYEYSGISMPERKGRKISPYRKKQLDYKRQMRRYWDGKDHRKREKIIPRRERQQYRTVLERATHEAERDEESALTLADALRAIKRSHFSRSGYVSKIPLREAVQLKAERRSKLEEAKKRWPYHRQHYYDQAISTLSRKIERQPDNYLPYLRRGWAYIRTDKYETAIDDFTQAMSLAPGNGLTYYCRGWAYYNLLEYDRAIEDYNQSLKLKPDYHHAYNDRAIVYADKGMRADAFRDLNRAIEIKPDFASAYYNRALLYKNHRSTLGQAIADLKKAVELSDDPDLSQAAEEELARLVKYSTSLHRP